MSAPCNQIKVMRLHDKHKTNSGGVVVVKDVDEVNS